MKIIDVNILLYVVNSNDPHHERTLKWWDAAINGDEPIGLCWVALLGFIRIGTNPRVMVKALSVPEALFHVNSWLECPISQFVFETSRHWEIMQSLLLDRGTRGNLTTDAYLAALAISHDATLVSCDSDFGQFPNLRWQHPLAS